MMKLIKIIGILDAILLIVFGILYFVNISYPCFVLPVLLIILIFCAGIQKTKNIK